MKEAENILKILIQTSNAIKTDETTSLKDLSDQTLHVASTTGDSDNITVAVIVYSLGKIFERQDYRSLKGWEDFKRISLSSLRHSIEDLKKENYEHFREDFVLIRKAINKISGKLRRYIEDVFKKAEINKASRIHEHGISLEKTAKMLGISMYDLQAYTGQTGISEVPLNQTINPKNRIKMLEELFG